MSGLCRGAIDPDPTRVIPDVLSPGAAGFTFLKGMTVALSRPGRPAIVKSRFNLAETF
jgi:hypothetical protein